VPPGPQGSSDDPAEEHRDQGPYRDRQAPIDHEVVLEREATGRPREIQVRGGSKRGDHCTDRDRDRDRHERHEATVQCPGSAAHPTGGVATPQVGEELGYHEQDAGAEAGIDHFAGGDVVGREAHRG
jgi:hypothetical protein